jgi:hypothetical protein
MIASTLRAHTAATEEPKNPSLDDSAVQSRNSGSVSAQLILPFHPSLTAPVLRSSPVCPGGLRCGLC